MSRWLTLSAAVGSRAAVSSLIAAAPHVPPPSGLTVVRAALPTPGDARSCSTRRRASSAREAPGGYAAGGGVSSIVKSPCASNPSGSVCSRTKFLMIRPAPASSISVSAVSATISAPRRRRPAGPPLVERPPSRSDRLGSARQLPNAGTMPATIALASDAPIANASTRQSVCGVASPSCSRRTDGTSVEVSGLIHAASSRPTPQPIAASTRLSASSWRTWRDGDAPSTDRIANSRRRDTDRASSSVATLTHAMSSRKTTMSVSARSGASWVPTRFSRIVITSSP